MQYKLYQTLLIVSTCIPECRQKKMDVNHVGCILIPFRLQSNKDRFRFYFVTWVDPNFNAKWCLVFVIIW